ncbi:SH3 domain-containing protein [Streptomyces sp. NPDC057694]|uniref:SH3 domain-containing protein n=1 Tax=Streptomyces sp. NPDC057694 TaxID=3346216 RepID=UPI00369FF4D3
MRKKISSAVAGVVLAGSALLAGAPPAAAGCGYYVTDTVNLRSGPGTGYSSYGLLRKDDQVAVLGKKGQWRKVTPMNDPKSGLSIDAKGWVRGDYLQKATCMQLD